MAYLSIEVPRWRREHPCYSCHNNGDATRALIAASARGHAVGDAIDDTLAWLATPERWDSNAQRGGSEDLPLARIQFASALASMVAVGRATPDALDRAAALLVVHQQDDGSWRLSESQILGGATFYGTSLATAMARRSLAGARTDAVQRPLAKAGAWLRTTNPAAVLDASAVLLGLERDVDPAAVAQRQKVPRRAEARPGAGRRLGPVRHLAVGAVRHRACGAGAGGRAERRSAVDLSLFRSRSATRRSIGRESISSALRIRTEAGRRRRGRRTERATRSASRRPPGRCWRCSSRTDRSTRGHCQKSELRIRARRSQIHVI